MKIPEKAWDGKDHFLYKNHVTMQTPVAMEIFDEFFKYNKFDNIIEIGTAGGGWSIYLKEHAIAMNALFVTYDIQNRPEKKSEFLDMGIDFRLQDALSQKSIDEIRNILSNGGRNAIFCDGGDKILEFNTFSYMLKDGDFIFAHDYSPTYEYLVNTMRGKYWDWGEIMDEHIQECMNENRIIKYLPEYFIPSAWVAAYKN